jgi:hypothetical protein
MLLAKLRTVWRLGPINVASALCYQFKKSAGLYERHSQPSEILKLTADLGQAQTDRSTIQNRDTAQAFRSGHYRAFGGDFRKIEWPPNWHKNILTGEIAEATSPWWKKPTRPRGDVKGIWELSRFDWALDLAKAHIIEPEAGHLTALNEAIADWQRKNPPYLGPNWECGQETSLRLMNVLEAVRILGSTGIHQPGLHSFITSHLRRIAITINYAIAQDNNHGTSEAAGLFVGSAYLQAFDPASSARENRAYLNTGRYWLENRVRKLIMHDGGFAQYSLTYHRLMLDTLAVAEHWRNALSLPVFSSGFLKKMQAAVSWYAALINPVTGDGPNLGTNDGAHVLRVKAESYRNFRPSLERAKQAFGAASAPLDKENSCYPNFGLLTFKSNSVYGFLKYPSLRFRPAQSDPLHLDLWTVDGRPLVVDSGTMSYFNSKDLEGFSGIAHHNTIQFDDHEPMRRWTKFLYLDWPNADIQETKHGKYNAVGYKDYTGARHIRTLEFSKERIQITDAISGFKTKAILRWHFGPHEWRSCSASFQSHVGRITCTSNGKSTHQRIVEKQYSPTYATALAQQCLEVEVGPDTSVLTTIFELT